MGFILRNRMDQGEIAMKGFFTFLSAPEMDPHHQMQLSVILRILVGEGFNPLQRCSRLILKPQPTGLNISLFSVLSRILIIIN